MSSIIPQQAWEAIQFLAQKHPETIGWLRQGLFDASTATVVVSRTMTAISILASLAGADSEAAVALQAMQDVLQTLAVGDAANQIDAGLRERFGWDDMPTHKWTSKKLVANIPEDKKAMSEGKDKDCECKACAPK